MSNHDAKVQLVWIPVQDANGRTRMEMRWLDPQAPNTAHMPYAA